MNSSTVTDMTSSMKAEILEQSVQSIVDRLYRQAYGGDYPDGMFDTPASCSLSRVVEGQGDISTEVLYDEDLLQLSEIPGMNPVSRKEEKGPSDTKPVFEGIDELEILPGLMGAAVGNFGKFRAVCKSQGQDTKKVDQWFANQWGIPDDFDLDSVTPQVRSHGATLLAGLESHLAPYTSLYPASDRVVKVKWRDVTRKKFGENAMVDWPKLTAVARFIAKEQFLEWSSAKHGKLEFTIVKGEIPHAKPLVFPDFSMLDPGKKRTNGFGIKGLVETLNKATKLRHKMVEVKSNPAVLFPILPEAKFVLAESIVPRNVFARLPSNFLETNGDNQEKEDILSPEPEPDFKQQKLKTLAFENFLQLFVDANYTSNYDRNYLIGLELDLDADQPLVRRSAEVKTREVIDHFIPKDIILKYVQFISVVTGSKARANALVVEAMHGLNVPHGFFRQTDMLKFWEDIQKVFNVRVAILDRIANASSRTFATRALGSLAGLRVRKLLASKSNIFDAVIEVVSLRRNFWVNEYWARAKRYPQKGITYKTRAQLFSKTQFTIDEKWQITVNKNEQPIKNVMKRIALSYAKRNRHYHTGGTVYFPKDFGTLIQMVTKLDEILEPEIRFSVLYHDYLKSVDFLLKDVQDFVKRLLDNAFYMYTDLEVIDEFPEGIDDYGDPDGIDDEEVKEEKKEIVFKANFNAKNKEEKYDEVEIDDGDLDGDLGIPLKDEEDKKILPDPDLDDDLGPSVNKELTSGVVLKDELEEDHQHIPKTYIKEFVEGKPTFVSVEDYARYKVDFIAFVRERILARATRKIDTSEGDDLS